jgi:hypothetical protein
VVAAVAVLMNMMKHEPAPHLRKRPAPVQLQPAMLQNISKKR